MIDVRKNAECHLSLGVASGALFAGYAQIAASTMVDAYSSAVPGRLIAACATIGAVRIRLIADQPTDEHVSFGARKSAAPDQPTDEHVSFDARKSAAIAYRMLTAALARVAHDPNRNAVFPCHP